jgi:hypothetical protein
MKSTRKRTMRLMAFGPALVMVCIAAYAASGVSVVSSATGASTVGVAGSVTSTFSADPGLTGGTGPLACGDESVGAFASTAGMSDGCQVSFSSNNGTGSHIVFENDQAGAVPFFCGDPDGAGALPRDCSTAANTVSNLTGTGNQLTADSFGLALMAIGGDAGVVAGSGVSAPNAAPGATDNVWAGIPAQGSAAELCRFPGAHTTNTTCQFKFGALGKGGVQGAGDYTGTLRLTTALT